MNSFYYRKGNYYKLYRVLNNFNILPFYLYSFGTCIKINSLKSVLIKVLIILYYLNSKLKLITIVNIIYSNYIIKIAVYLLNKLLHSYLSFYIIKRILYFRKNLSTLNL